MPINLLGERVDLPAPKRDQRELPKEDKGNRQVAIIEPTKSGRTDSGTIFLLKQ